MSEKLRMMAFPNIDFVKKPYSEKTEVMIDEEIQKITEMCIEKVDSLIKDKKEEIEKVKILLLKKETLSHNDLKDILGEKSASDNSNYQAYLKEEQNAQEALLKSNEGKEENEGNGENGNN